MNTACVDCWLPVTSDMVCILWKCHAAVCCKRYVVSGLVSIACVCLCTYMHVFGGIIYHFSLFSWCKLHSIQLGVKSPPLDHWSAHIAVSRCGIAPVGWLRIQPSCLQDVLNYQIKIPAGKSHTCDVPFYRALTLPVFPLYKDFFSFTDLLCTACNPCYYFKSSFASFLQYLQSGRVQQTTRYHKWMCYVLPWLQDYTLSQSTINSMIASFLGWNMSWSSPLSALYSK